MSFRVELRPAVKRKLLAWKLPDPVLVDVHLQFQKLESDRSSLARAREPFDGMVLPHWLVDPDNRLCEHVFYFHVVYSQDEETLIVANGIYQRTSL